MNLSLVVLAALLIVGGVVLLAVGDATGVRAAGMGLLGTGGVLAVAYAFLLVGRSEDRDRERRA